MDDIAKEIRAYLCQNQTSFEFETIAKCIALKFNHGIYLDDIEVALAKLISQKKIIRSGNSYRLI